MQGAGEAAVGAQFERSPRVQARWQTFGFRAAIAATSAVIQVFKERYQWPAARCIAGDLTSLLRRGSSDSIAEGIRTAASHAIDSLAIRK